MTVCLFGGSYGRRAEALQVEAEREVRKEKVGRRHLKKERRRNEMNRMRKRKVTSTEGERKGHKVRQRGWTKREMSAVTEQDDL